MPRAASVAPRAGEVPSPAAPPTHPMSSVSPERGGAAVRSVAVQVTDEHIPALADFYRAMWDPTVSAGSVAASRTRAAASNPAEPGRPHPTFLLLIDGTAVGHITTHPARFWDGNAAHVGHWLDGFMVLPEHRNGMIGFHVLREATRALPLAGTLTVSAASRRLFEALGYRNLGQLTNHLLLLRPAKFFRRVDLAALGLEERLPRALMRAARFAQRSGAVVPAGWLLDGAQRAWAGIAKLRARGVDAAVCDGSPAADDLDALWARCRGGYAFAAVRDAAYLHWRYPAAEGRYQFVLAREGGEPVGLAVVRRPRPGKDDARLRGLSVAVLSDLLLPMDRLDAAPALLRAAAVAARRHGADALLASVSHAAARRALTAFGFVPVPANLHFLLRDAEVSRRFAGELGEWWLTRGDCAADSSF
jgi:RimJ/RimL family protein N-acetyltransferase